MDDKVFQMVENMIKDGRIKIIKLEPDGIRLHNIYRAGELPCRY